MQRNLCSSILTWHAIRIVLLDANGMPHRLSPETRFNHLTVSARALISCFRRIFFLVVPFPATDTIDTKVNTHVLLQSTTVYEWPRAFCVFFILLSHSLSSSLSLFLFLLLRLLHLRFIIHTFFHFCFVIQNSLKSIVRFEFPFFSSGLNEER